MRVLVISQFFWPENFRINNIVEDLIRRDHDVTVLTGLPNYPSGSVFPEYQENPDGFVDYHGAKVVRVPLSPRKSGVIRLILNYFSFFFLASTLGLWRLRKQQFDVVFVFEPSPITVGIPAIIYRKITKTPVIFWVLDLWPETLKAIGVVKSPFLLSLVGRLVKLIYNQCDMVLGQSKGFLKNIAQYCTDQTKIHYFPNWAENIYKTSGSDLAPEVTPQTDVFNIMFAGNVGVAQDFETILDAAEQLKQEKLAIRWLIVGDGRMSGWLESEVVKRGLDQEFVFCGRFPEERMPSFFNHADALLVSLKADPVFSLTIPGKVQSYLMSGIPILGLLDGEGARVIQEAQAGLASPSGDVQGVVTAVRRLTAMSSAELSQMGERGRRYAEKEFGKDALMSQLEGWMSGLVVKNEKLSTH